MLKPPTRNAETRHQGGAQRMRERHAMRRRLRAALRRHARAGRRRRDRAPTPRRLPVAAALLFVLLAAAGARAAGDDAGAIAERNGWRYLIDKLAADGIPRTETAAAFADPRIPPFDGLSFQLDPHESRARYRSLQSPASIRAARQCR